MDAQPPLSDDPRPTGPLPAFSRRADPLPAGTDLPGSDPAGVRPSARRDRIASSGAASPAAAPTACPAAGDTAAAPAAAPLPTRGRTAAPPTALPSAASALLHAVRAGRAAHATGCPRCGFPRVTRWGSFSGRRRFRCPACRRTFSDLTGTPMAYTKRLHLWNRFLVRMHRAEPLRNSAARLGVHVSTTFRWRHAVLSSALGTERAFLTSPVELDELAFAYSEKGRRNRSVPSRRRGVRDLRERFALPRVATITLCSREGGVWGRVLHHPYATRAELAPLLETSVEQRAVVYNRFHCSSAIASLLRRAGFRPVMVRAPRATTRLELEAGALGCVVGYLRRLREWLLRFRGVATRYLAHYLAWHRLLETLAGGEWAGRLLLRLIAAAPAASA
jgi:transposase-like protein